MLVTQMLYFMVVFILRGISVLVVVTYLHLVDSLKRVLDNSDI